MHLALWRLCATALGIVCLHVNAYGAAAQIEHKIVAHNYAVARNAAHEAVLHAVSQAKPLADGDVWIEGAPQCRLPIESSSCLISFTAAGLAGFLPEYWNPVTDRFGQPRWKVLVRNKTSYVFGEIDDAEIETVQQVTKNSYSTAVCRASQANGILCVPSLLEAVNGSLASLEIPSEIVSVVLAHKTVIVSAIRIAP